MATRCLVRPFECGGEVTAALYMYSRVYAAQIVLVTLLSAVTIYRREMSCNHEYSSPSEEGEGKKGGCYEKKAANAMDNSGKEWEDVLEGAGKWGSGKPLTGVIGSIWSCLTQIKRSCAGGDVNERAVWTEDMSDDLLEGAGLSLSGEPLWSSFISVWARIWLKSLTQQQGQGGTERDALKPSPFFTDLLPDAQVHILSFLDPKDVTSFACCSTKCKDMVENPANDTCLHLWKSLWDRDYAWLIRDWKVGVEAKQRSLFDRPIDKKLYMEFGQTFVNYLLVGHNTNEDCLVGLHGNIYDLTNFVDQHPGSQDTLLVHAGQDVTQIFDSIGHSFPARKLAAKMCVVVDQGCFVGGCGTRRPENVAAADRRGIPLERRRRRPSALLQIRNRLENEERDAKRTFARLLPKDLIRGTSAIVYYDAFDREWKAWYTSDSFETRHL